ncbi:hypothetical protein [Candidatus Uabimicrobium amorphum]|uniref:Uncharacterized protein n=1 Tax=Uabimicrobium amorphum TaxID=2596890 RepID=A0A5S9IJS3_UABAM|nr:hypothetical protein [Candidatus Uabimicrobium amorphum]BBM83143.1 hypothetical protein UABAM_01494 [Candidatus Uabimicrobium amorphum]
MVRAFYILTIASAMLFVVVKTNSPDDLHINQTEVFTETMDEKIPEWDLLLVEEEKHSPQETNIDDDQPQQIAEIDSQSDNENDFDYEDFEEQYDDFFSAESVSSEVNYTTDNSTQLFIEDKLKMYLQERKQQRLAENAFRPGSRNADDSSFRPGSRNTDDTSFRPGSRTEETSYFRPGSRTEHNGSFRPGSSSTFRPGSQKFRPGSSKSFRPGSSKSFRPGSSKSFRPGSVKSFRPGSAKSFRPGSAKSFRPGGVVFDTQIRHPQLIKMSIENSSLVFLTKSGKKVYFKTNFSNEELQRLAVAVKEWEGFALSQNNTDKGCYTFSHPLLYGTSIIDVINELDTLTGEIYYGNTRRASSYGKYESQALGYRSVMDDLHAFLRENDTESAKILLLEYFNFFDGNPATFTKQRINTALENDQLLIDKQILALELFPSLCDSNSMYRAVSPQELFTQQQFVRAHSAVALFNKNNMNYAQDVRMEKAIEVAQIVGLFLGYSADINIDAESFAQKTPGETYEPQAAFGYNGSLYNRVWKNLTSQEKQTLRRALDGAIDTMRQIPERKVDVVTLENYLIPQIWRKVNATH